MYYDGMDYDQVIAPKITSEKITADKLAVIMLGILLGTTLFAGTICTNIAAHADTSTATDVAVSVSAACNFSGVVDMAHSATITPSALFTENIGLTSFTASCNDPDGYSIYAVGYSGTPSEEGNTNLINTTNSNLTIATHVYDSSYTSDSYWSMKLTTGQGADAATIIDSPINYNNYVAVPSTYDKVATKTSATTGVSSASFTTTYGAYATTTQAAGSYEGKVKYTLVHPHTAPAPWSPQPVVTNPGYISYNTNAPTTEVTDSMGYQSITTSQTSADLWASNFQRPGYGFAGWNTEPDYSGTSYGPNETISFTAGQYSGDNPGLSLYAMWIPSAGNLQDFTTTQCNALTKANEVTNPTDILTQSLTALTDSRDNQTYAVARLADGNCWMIENLRLADKKPDNTPITINSTNTNNPISTFTQLGASTDPTSTAWCQTNDSACDDQSMLFSRNTTNPANPMTASNTSTPVYSYGNYYNWYSATAGNGTYSTGRGVVTNGDICPIGWHLPYGGDGTGAKGGNTSGGFYFLGDTLGATASSAASSNIWRGYPQNFVYSGYAGGSSVDGRSTYGLYWSSRAYNSLFAFFLDFGSRIVGPGTDYRNGKYYGGMARCMVSGS